MRRPYTDPWDRSLLQTLGLPGADSDTRASDAERDRAADALRQHHADGRLSTDELEERTGRAYAATTRGALTYRGYARPSDGRGGSRYGRGRSLCRS